MFITKITRPHFGGYTLRYEDFRTDGERVKEDLFISDNVISFLLKGHFLSEDDIRRHRKLGIFELNPDTSAVLPLKITELGEQLAHILSEGDFTELKPVPTGVYFTVRNGPEFEIKKFPKTVTVNGVDQPIEIEPYWALRAIPDCPGARIPKEDFNNIKHLYPELGRVADELIAEAIEEYCRSFNTRYEKTSLSSVREELFIDFIMTLIERTKTRLNEQSKDAI